MSMPLLNLSLTRPFFSFFRSCNHFRYPHTPNSFTTISSSSFPPKGISKISSFVSHGSSNSSKTQSLKQSKKARFESPENVFKHKLDMCSKNNNLQEALILYDGAKGNGISLTTHHYNILLYLCSLCANNSGLIEGLDRGFEIFKQMGIDKVAPNEATFTSLARLAVAKQDPDMAFDLVKQMKDNGIMPKLRSYGPALFGFCDKGDADKAYDVYAHMRECGVVAEESELSALLKVNVCAKRGDRVYEMLHRIRGSVRQVSEETAKIVEDWFTSEAASEVGVEDWDADKVSEGVVRGGGGWHGQGWLGKGKWNPVRAEMDKTGVCSSCGEKLVCIDIDPKETEEFVSSLSSLACKKERKAKFSDFQEWLKKHGPFDAVVDGANVGLIDSRTFNFRQLNNVVSQLQQLSPSKKLPLIVLHKGRVQVDNPNTKRLLETWRKAGALYATPTGSNDDWYWLYAAVSCNSLMITNDEMRDHLFQLLGNSIFPRWKEKHQVRMTVSKSGLTLHMPPPYSIVIQESKQGSWHVPTVIGDDLETPRQWLCATRSISITSKNRDARSSLSGLFSASR